MTLMFNPQCFLPILEIRVTKIAKQTHKYMKCVLRDNMHANPIRAIRAWQSTVHISSVMDSADLFVSK